MATSSITPAAGNVYYGRGAVYFDRWEAGVASGVWHHLGNVNELSITFSTTEKELYSSMSPKSALIASVVTQSGAEVSLNGHEYVPFNIALALRGTVDTYDQTTDDVTGEVLFSSSVKGVYVFTDYKSLSSVVVYDDSNGIDAVDTGDGTVNWILDTDTGLFVIPTGSKIADASVVTIDYTYATVGWNKVAIGDADKIEGGLKFVSDPAHGPWKMVELWHVTVTSDGPVSYIADDWSTWKLKMKVQDDSATTGHSTTPFGREIELQ